VGAQAMADRYAYIPFLGLYVMAVWGIGEWASSRGISAKYLAVAGVLCVGSLSAVAYVQASYWHDSLTLWSHALAVTDRNYVAQDNMGNALVLAGKYDEAIPHFEEAVRINPRDPLAELNLGTYDQQHGKLAESIDKYEMVLRLTVDPRLRANAFANMGSAYRKLGRYSRAQACYESALDLDPVSPIAVVGLGLVFEKDGNPAKAAEYFSRAVQSQPTDVSWLLLSEAFERSGQGEKAKAAATEAERISPDLKQAEQQANQLQSE